jgi:hypothetical protein
MRATSNPGGPGHHWVKKTFIDPSTPGKPFWATDENGEVSLGLRVIAERVSLYLNVSLFQLPSLTTLTYQTMVCMKPTFFLCLSINEDSCLKVTGTSTKGQHSQSLIDVSHVIEPFDIPTTGFVSELLTTVTDLTQV